MKNIVIIIILFQSFQSINAQQIFSESQEYTYTKEIMNQGKERPSYVVNLIRAEEKTNDKIATLTITDIELFEDIFITTLENPGLEGISKVIKMEVEYLGCCAHVDAYYYMVKDDNSITTLPEISNVYCENSDTDYQYIFPNQEYGIDDNILETQTFYQTTTTAVKYVNLKQSFAWNNGSIEESKKTTAITAGY
ncbi:hypothetical protein ABW636_08820 [Aquimarina sp. 2201CG1-2-11]|uniref:hypothetical protein n=1 Tax=Aquimarina discodermiae TaxID=3231043 RepID=UPI003462BAE0